MLRMKVLPTVFLVAPAIVLLMARSVLSEPAAKACKTRPAPTTPRGDHWYYRVNRADKRHCWYLGAEKLAAKARSVAAPTLALQAESANAGAARAGAQAAGTERSAPVAPAMAAPAPIVFLESPVAARWPSDLPRVQDLRRMPPRTMSSSYADGPAVSETTEPMPTWPLREAARGQPASAGAAALGYFSAVGSFAIALLLLIGWAAKFARRPRRAGVRNDWRATIDRLRRRIGFAGAAGTSAAMLTPRGGPSWPPTPTDPAQDLKKSLAELMRDLRRVDGPIRSGDVLARNSGQDVYGRILQAAE